MPTLSLLKRLTAGGACTRSGSVTGPDGGSWS